MEKWMPPRPIECPDCGDELGHARLDLERACSVYVCHRCMQEVTCSESVNDWFFIESDRPFDWAWPTGDEPMS